MSQQWLLPGWEWSNRGCWRHGTQMWKCFHSNAGNTGNTGSAHLKQKKKKWETKQGRYIKIVYGGKEHLIGSLQVILIFSTPISSNFWAAEAGSLGVVRVKGAMLSVCVLLSHVQLFVTPWTEAHQASLSMEFSRQEYWNGLPFPSPTYLPNPGTTPRSPALQAGALWTEPLQYTSLQSSCT